MMNTDTYVCNVCKKAIDIPVNPHGISALPRCKITKNCTGIMSLVSPLFVTEGQYHTNISADTWTQTPLIYDHNQVASRKTWVINHNLGASVIISVKVPDAFGVLVPLHDFDIVYQDNFTSTIEFAANYTGVALCTTRQTASVQKVVAEIAAAPRPLSINNTLTIATKVPNAVTIQLSVQPNPLRPSDIVDLAVTANPPASTPWVGASYVIISNQRYLIRYVNISDVLLFHRAAATFFVSLFNTADVARGDTFVLLSDDPFEHSSDRTLNFAVDLADLAINKQSNTVLTQDALLCTSAALSTIYPTLKVT